MRLRGTASRHPSTSCRGSDRARRGSSAATGVAVHRNLKGSPFFFARILMLAMLMLPAASTVAAADEVHVEVTETQPAIPLPSESVWCVSVVNGRGSICVEPTLKIPRVESIADCASQISDHVVPCIVDWVHEQYLRTGIPRDYDLAGMAQVHVRGFNTDTCLDSSERDFTLGERCSHAANPESE